MSFGNISNLYVIGRYLYSSLFTQNFRNTDLFKDYILNQTFSREISSGNSDLSVFSPTKKVFV